MRPRSALFVTLAALVLMLAGCSSQKYLERGREALLLGDPIAARGHFDRALDHDDDLAGDPEFVRDYHVARRDAAVAEGHKHLRQQQPLRAITRFEVALGLEAGWPAAVEGLGRAHADAADEAHRLALDHADANDLPAARAALDAALRHAPDHPRANAARRSLDLPAAQQPGAYRRAADQRQQRDWDAARASLRDTIAAHPDFLPARAALPATLDAAAADALRLGNAALAEARFDDAEAEFTRIANYRPSHPAVQPALGRVDLARADQTLDQDHLPGAALLWYRQARDHFKAAANRSAGQPSGAGSYESSAESAVRGLAAATQQIRDQHRLTLHLRPQSTGHPRLADDFAKRVQQQLESRPAAALAFGPTGQPVDINLLRLDLAPAEVRGQPLRHTYEVEVDQPNPDLPGLREELHRLNAEIAEMRDDEARLERRHEHLYRHHPVGPECGCNLEVHRVYRQLLAVRLDLDDAYEDHHRASDRLTKAPALLTYVHTEHWPYTLFTHERTVTLTADFVLLDQPPHPVVVRLIEKDTAVDRPRPDVGLAEDPLEMLSNEQLQADLLNQGVDRLALDLAAALTAQRVEALTTQARLLQNTDPLAAREASVAAEVLGQ